MAHKVATLLSLIFVFQLLLLMGDMISVQVLHTEMQSFATTVTHEVSLRGRLDQPLIDRAMSKGYDLVCLATCFPQFGDTLTYSLTLTYSPLILSNEPMELNLIRYVVIGVYY